MKKLNIALLAGGDSSEREVSLGSAAQVCDALDRDRYDVYLIDIAGSEWICRSEGFAGLPVDKNDFSINPPCGKICLEYALVMIHGTPGEDGRLQGYLDMMRIPYSSCGVTSSALTFDKSACKRAVSAAGVRVAKEMLIRKGEVVDSARLVAELGLPMFIKPNASGSSCGVTKVGATGEIEPALKVAFAESDSVMAEQFVEGCEIACGLMLTAEKDYIFPLTEIIPKNEFFDYEAKYTCGMSEEITPARIEPAVAGRIGDLSVRAYRACGCRGIVRADYIVNKEGEPVFIEMNSIPGMSGGSIVPKQAACAGISLGELFDIVIRNTL